MNRRRCGLASNYFDHALKAAATVTTVTAMFRYYFTGFAAGRCAKYCDERVGISVSRRPHLQTSRKNLAMTIAPGDLVQTLSCIPRR